MLPPHIRLEEKDFAQLIRGKIIQLKAHDGMLVAEVALADLGWDRMFFHIERAKRDAGDDFV